MDMNMNNPEQHLRGQRTIGIVHAEAFQLMLYRAEDGSEAWFWNSRDGVTPFITSINGKEFQHVMRGYPTRYQAALPIEASFVWVSYDRPAWEAMRRKQYDVFASRDDEYGRDFLERYPSPADWIRAGSFEHGQPRQLTREEFLSETSEWMGKSS